jgi:hypothetical protein
MKTLGFLVAVCALSGSAMAGPDWVEIGDAGSEFDSAQRVVGIGQPQRISGSLSSGFLPDFEDIYIITIDDPSAFRFDLTNAPLNTMVYLFNVTLADELLGLLANDDASAVDTGSLIDTPWATDSSGAKVSEPGTYAIAITGFHRRPLSRTGEIFAFATPTEVSGPDGPGAVNPLSGWTGSSETGSYSMELEGIGYVDVPAPAAVLPLLGAGLLTLRRRR